MKLDAAKISIIVATSVTTALSLVYVYPHTRRIIIRTRVSTSPTAQYMANTTHIASFAARGFPAPNSLETRVLYQKITFHSQYRKCT